MLAVAVPTVGALARRPPPPPVGVATSQTTPPATPADPSGRFLPTSLPGDLRIQTEQEVAAVDAGADGWSRTYARRGPLPGDQDTLTISLLADAPSLDVDRELARYPGAGAVTVQGRPGVFLPYVAARSEAGVSWNPAPGFVATVSGSGVSEAGLTTVAEGLRLPPQLDATPLPEAFTEWARRDGQPFAPLTPPTPSERRRTADRHGTPRRLHRAFGWPRHGGGRFQPARRPRPSGAVTPSCPSPMPGPASAGSNEPICWSP
ncbi:MAG TPA: hypothetical protein VM388_09220 [Acidimicrobiales bacterium]|nr:hypothetical protein [Acidimicrobiales bacterium]HWI03033.1 hypothetical protein [Acidimicrobiales bacterium]